MKQEHFVRISCIIRRKTPCRCGNRKAPKDVCEEMQTGIGKNSRICVKITSYRYCDGKNSQNPVEGRTSAMNPSDTCFRKARL